MTEFAHWFGGILLLAVTLVCANLIGKVEALEFKVADLSRRLKP